jgi:hypothetical protein
VIDWVRSWPANPPAGRAHVVDQLPRLIIDDYDYTPLSQLVDGRDGIVVIEWDIALCPASAARFHHRCASEPNKVRAGAYQLNDSQGVRWAHRLVYGPEASDERWAIRDPDSPSVDYVGFGLIYLPSVWIRGFLQAPAPERGRPPWCPQGLYRDERFTDQTFSTWLRWRTAHGPVPVEWDLPVVHLHGLIGPPSS